MATEFELRQSVVKVMQGWLGYSEKNGKFKQIIDLYNTQKPLPVGYKVQYDDEWCATTVTAAGMAAGLHDIIFGECSCSRMIALYQKAGRWMERDDYRPSPGDIIMYYWKDGSNYATTDCTANPNHVGIVEKVEGNTITVLEGNKGEAVARRTISVNGRYIRGYCLPDYASKATESEDDEDMDISKLTDEQIIELANRIDVIRGKQEVSSWAAVDWDKAKKKGVFDGTSPKNPLNREQAAVVLSRLNLI